MGYELRLTESAKRDMRQLEAQIAKRIDEKLLALAEDPRPAGSRKLQMPGNLRRIRIGDYRAIYHVDDEARRVTVVRVGHRNKAYRRISILETWASRG